MTFILAFRDDWRWPNLTPFRFTLNLFLTVASIVEVSSMLKLAAAAAARMLRLETIEFCNRRRVLEATLQYRRGAGVTRRVIWDLFLEPDVIKTCEALRSSTILVA